MMKRQNMVPLRWIAPRGKKRRNGFRFCWALENSFSEQTEPLTAERRRWRCTCPKGGVERLSDGLLYKTCLEFGMKSCEIKSNVM